MDQILLEQFVVAWQGLSQDQFNALSAPFAACVQNVGEDADAADENGNLVYGNLQALLDAAESLGLE